MVRRLFNATCDFYKGPGTSTPGHFVGNFPCHIVEVDGIFLTGTGAPATIAWITIDAYEPQGAWLPSIFGMDPRLSDQVALGSGHPVSWWVLYVEHVIWKALTPYWRAMVVHLPLPAGLPPEYLALRGEAIADARIVFPSTNLPDQAIALGGVLHQITALGLSDRWPRVGDLQLVPEPPHLDPLVLLPTTPASGSLQLAPVAPSVPVLALSSPAGPPLAIPILLAANQPFFESVGLTPVGSASGSLGLGGVIHHSGGLTISPVDQPVTELILTDSEVADSSLQVS